MTTQPTPISAYSGQHTTHVNKRPDAVIHKGRDFVPTTNETKYVSTLEELKDAGGSACWNEDQTEIWLTLPEGFKFSIKMFEQEKRACNSHAALVEALQDAQYALIEHEVPGGAIDAVTAALTLAKGK